MIGEPGSDVISVARGELQAQRETAADAFDRADALEGFLDLAFEVAAETENPYPTMFDLRMWARSGERRARLQALVGRIATDDDEDPEEVLPAYEGTIPDESPS